MVPSKVILMTLLALIGEHISLIEKLRILRGLQVLQIQNVGVAVLFSIFFEPLKLLKNVLIRLEQIRQSIHVGVRLLHMLYFNFS